MSAANPEGSHPRPDLRRDRWVDLNGWWSFSFDEPTFDSRIRVPFAYQSETSGIGTTEQHEVLWYRRPIPPIARDPDERLLLHVGAADFETMVWVNDVEVGSHRGGHTSFTFDITDALDDPSSEAELTMRVIDEFRADQVRGKQTTTFPYLVHYRPTSGIWLPVWIEVAGARWIRELHVTATADGDLTVAPTIESKQNRDRVHVLVTRDGQQLADEHAASVVTCRVDDVEPWSPEHPVLYELVVEVDDDQGNVVDRVASYVGFRTVEIVGDEWRLNGQPIRQRLVLDQGYWPDTLITPPSMDAIRTDLDFVRDAGFDGVRKHQKIEDPRWLHEADRRGLLVWEEMPSPFGLARIRGQLEADFRAEWQEAVRRDRNHPCVIAWVPFNESWGIQGVHRSREFQDLVRSVVTDTRSLDPTRPVVDNSGWCHVDTDVVDVHDYDQDPAALTDRWSGLAERGWEQLAQRGDNDLGDNFDLDTYLRHIGVDDVTAVDRRELMAQLPVTDVWAEDCTPPAERRFPIVLSEFGGAGLAVDADVRDRFDYGGAADADELLDRFRRLVTAAESIPRLAGWCWTQLTDVEQEVNGLMTADRRPKVAPRLLREALEHAPWTAQR